MCEIWQYPYVDVFKSFNLWDWKNSKKSGEVAEELDSAIGRKVITITGTVPSNNFVTLPRPQAEMKSLALKGRYIYICAAGIENKPFVLHLDYGFSDRKSVRLSLSNMYKDEGFDQLTIHVPVKLPAEKWAIICVDAKGLFVKYGCIKDVKEPHQLKAATMCANIKLSKIATSDKLYYFDTFPKEISFKSAHRDKWLDRYAWIEPFPCEHPVSKSPEEKEHETENQPKIVRKSSKKPAGREAVPDKSAKEQLEEEARYTQIRAKSEETKTKLLQKVLVGRENLTGNEQMEPRVSDSSSAVFRSPITKTIKMARDNLIQLRGVIGATVSLCPEVCWTRGPNREALYSAGAILIAMDTVTGKQRLFRGHSQAIRSICISPKGDVVGSCDRENIRVWSTESGKCLGTWKTDNGAELKHLSLSSDGNLIASSATDPHSRDVITVWDLRTMEQINAYQPHPQIVARQVSPYGIECIKFGPEIATSEGEIELQLCSCGKENIRFWKITKHTLKGTAVVLDKYSRDAVFTCLDFADKAKVYVGSHEGRILQINAETQELEFVYQLHEAGIRAVSVCEAFCVTGSDDLFIRVWPLDFSEFFMEAKHEALVQAVAIAPDNVEILCATDNGSIGVLDIPNQKYKTVIRSHTQEIIAADSLKTSLVTLSLDKTIRVWDLNTMQQQYEFASYEDQAVSVAIHPSKPVFACGFVSGSLRIFDIEKTSVTDEQRTYEGKSLVLLKYMPGHGTLVGVSQDGSVSAFNFMHQPVKQVPMEIPATYCGLAVDPTEQVFATIGSNSTSISVWDCATVNKVSNIPLSGCQARDIVMLAANLLVLTTDAQLRLFSLDGTALAKYLLEGVNVGPLIPHIRLTATANGKYVSIYGPDCRVMQLAMPSLGEQSAAPQMEIEEYAIHIAPVQAAMYPADDQSLFITAGGTEGIFFWTFQGDTSPANKEELSASLVATLRKSTTETAKKPPVRITQLLSGKVEIKAKEGQQQQTKPVEAIISEVLVSSSLTIPLPVEEEKQSVEGRRAFLNKENILILKKKELGLPAKHFWPADAPECKKAVPDLEGILSPELLVGYNGHAHDNIVWNEKAGWMAYSVRNKLVVEDVRAKTQEIFTDLEADISSLAMSRDCTMLASAAGSGSDKSAEIVLYKISEEKSRLRVHKRLAGHEKGVQAAEFSADHKYLCSIGRYPETAISLWDTELGTCLTTERLRFLSNDIKLDTNSEDSCRWITTGKNAVTEWKVRTEPALELEHRVIFYKEKPNTIFTCIAQTQRIRSEEAKLFIIGTTEGSAVLYNPNKRAFVGDYPIFEGQISCIVATSKSIVVGGTSDTILRWKLPEIETIHPNLFVSAPASLTVDGNVVAMWFDGAGEEGQVGTELGTVWYVNWRENAVIRLQSGHLAAQVRCLGAADGVLVSAAEDDTVKVWTQKGCDQVMEFEIPNVECTAVTVNETMCVAGFVDGNIRFFSLITLKTLGKAKVSSASIAALTISPSGATVFIGDTAGDLFLVSIESLEPLVVRTQKLLNMEGGITGLDIQRVGPKNKFLGATGRGTVKVWEKREKVASKTVDPFTLAKDWQFVEVDMFGILDSKEKKSPRKAKTQALFSDLNPNLCLCFISSIQSIYLRDLRMRQAVRTIQISQFPLSMALMPTKDRLAVGGSEGFLEVVDLRVDGKVRKARINSGAIEAVCASPDGTRVFTGSVGEILKWRYLVLH